ncbi:MAG TPA: 4-hydroxy-3-methylbut-2-enyl diphosphate reductase [Chloroflexota bacterium]|nr:4-hydroxy-3-methylbut-2-enyl diphosphate reductase [Chloroflexota bacterium]
MEIVRAKHHAGFCGGVKRAWRLATSEAETATDPVYISGKLIHNTPAMKELEEKGIHVLELSNAEGVQAGTTFILRAHGEGPAVYARARELGLRLIDGTCPTVRAVQRLARSLEEQGFQVVLFGHREHPEAKATIAHTQRGLIIQSAEEAAQLGRYAKIASIAQTTSSSREYAEVCRILKDKCDEFQDHGHICNFTQKAQEEAAELASRVDTMVVVGGRDSSNTRRLVEVCAERCATYQVETAEELQPDWFQGVARVGVAAGASTRDGDIEAVISRLGDLGAGAGAGGQGSGAGER